VSEPRDVRGVSVSDPDKVFFPESGITKGEIAEYYGRIADTMLPHVRGRCVSMHRWPDGIDGDDFYQKEAPEHFPDWIRTKTVPRKSGGSVRHGVAADARTLVYLADQGCLTPHVWLSPADAPARPDRVVFDVDPPAGDQDSMEEIRWTGRRLRRLLDELGAAPGVMTSGSRGLHVKLVVEGAADFDETCATDTPRRACRPMPSGPAPEPRSPRPSNGTSCPAWSPGATPCETSCVASPRSPILGRFRRSRHGFPGCPRGARPARGEETE